MLLLFPGTACNHNLSLIQFGSPLLHKCSKLASFVLCIGGMQCRLSTHVQRSDPASHPNILLAPSNSKTTVIATASTWGVWNRSIHWPSQGIGVMHNSDPISADTQIPSR